MTDRIVKVILRGDATGLKAAMAGAAESVSATEAEMSKATRTASAHGKALGALGAIGKGAGLAVGAGLAIAIKEATTFDSKMALVQTLSKATATQMHELAHSAQTAGTAYGYTANEVADAQAEMIKAGVSLKDIMGGGLKGTLALAAAGQMDVADATTVAASAMTQFNLKGKDIPHVADLLAAGADKALGSVQDLGYALEQSGTTAHQMGLSIEDTTGTLAAFAQAGMIGERGGTTLKQMLLQLAAPTKQAHDLMDKYHLSLYQANGELKSMPQIAGNVQRAFEHLTPAQRNAALGVIFGSRAIQGANILMQEGQKGIAGWISKVNDQGFAAQQASGKLNSLSGDLQKLKAAAENAFIGLGQGAQNPLRHFVQDATTEIEKLTKSGDLQRWGTEAGDVLQTVINGAKTLGPEVGSALKVVGGGIKEVADGFASLPKGVQQAIVTGSVVAYGAHKLGVDSLVTSGIKGLLKVAKSSGGPLGSMAKGVVPVYVTNKDFGGTGGTDGIGGSKDPVGDGAKAGGITAAIMRTLSGARMLSSASPEGVTAYASTLADWLGSATVRQRSQQAVQGLSFKMFPNAPGGQPLAQGKWWDPWATQFGKDDTAYLDNTLSKRVASHPAQTLQMLAKAAKEANIPITALIANLPKTAHGIALLDTNTKTASKDLKSASTDLKKWHGSLSGLPKQVRTQIKTPGLLASVQSVKILKDQYRLTPRQVMTTLKASGVVKTMADVREAQKTFHLTPRQVITLIEATGVRPTLANVAELHKKYKLTPHTVTTLLKATGTDFSLEQVAKLQKQYHLTPRQVTTLLRTIDLASPVIGHVGGLLDGLNGKTARTFIDVTTRHMDTRLNATNRHATGGFISGPGTATSDSIPAYLSNGEYVVKAAAVNKYGRAMFDQMNTMRYAQGGYVNANSGASQQLQAAQVQQQAGMIAQLSRQIADLGRMPTSLTLRLEDGTSFRAYVDGRADTRIRAHKNTGRR